LISARTDPGLKAPKIMLFDFKRMAFGCFKALVEY